MKSIFQLCRPRPDILQNDLREDQFAAQIYQVYRGEADPIYQDPQRFFENTYPTTGLRTLLTEALGRLTGARPNASPILRLETSFGGGKTHNLIALYHAARGHLPAALADRFVPSLAFLPRPDTVRIAVLAGNALEPAGLAHEDGVVVHTPWGEMAYQLAGSQGYALMREHDIRGMAPSIPLLEQVIGAQPALILIDEIAAFLRKARQASAQAGKLDEQVAPFLMALLEFAASRPHVVVVLTLATDDDAFAKETAALLQELRRISARQEQVLTPAEEDELPAIVTHRLFQEIRREEAEPVFHAYLEAYRNWEAQNIALPSRATRAEYLEEMRRAYPFHPELLYILTHKVATIPNFQRTRGALRLLARVVARLWRHPYRPISLIHPHHVDFFDPQIVSDLTSRLERPRFQQVIEADIASRVRPSHAQVGDEAFRAAGKPPYTQRVARTVFLHSLVQGMTSGVRLDELHLAVLEPGDEPLLVRQALEHLENHAWFFEFDGHRYRFKTEPSLNKIILDEMAAVGRIRAKEHLDDVIRRMWPSGNIKVVHFPREPGEVPDQGDVPQLVIIHFDAAWVTAQEAERPPDMVRRIFKYSGTMEAHRVYANYLAFLVADRDLIEPMIQQAQRALAVQRLLDDADRLQEFSKEQVRRLREIRQKSQMELRVAIARCYRHLYYPSAEAPAEYDRLAHAPLPPQDQGNLSKDQVAVVIRVLREHNKALTHDDRPKSAHYLKARAWPRGRDRISTADLRRAFAQSLRLPWLLDPNQLRRSIQNGIEQGVWVYYDARTGKAYDTHTPPPAIEISEDTFLYLPEAAREAGLMSPREAEPSKPSLEETLVVSGLYPRSAEEAVEEDERKDFQPMHASVLDTGTEPLPVRQAFIRLTDLAQEGGVPALHGLRLEISRFTPKTAAAALRTLAAALPLLPGKKRLDVQFSATLGQDTEVNFDGRVDHGVFRELVPTLSTLAERAQDAQLDLTLHLQGTPTLAVTELPTLADDLEPLGLGEIRLIGEPAEESP